MPLLVNYRHLETHPVRLWGELPVKELDLDPLDEVIQAEQALAYDLSVERFEGGLLVTGGLHLDLHCQCVRCLKSFTHHLRLEHWVRHLPLEGDERVSLVNDCVDLTPCVREDILLEFPQHPLCDPECQGLLKLQVGRPPDASTAGQSDSGSPAWNELNKLKL